MSEADEMMRKAAQWLSEHGWPNDEPVKDKLIQVLADFGKQVEQETRERCAQEVGELLENRLGPYSRGQIIDLADNMGRSKYKVKS